jgi:2-oxoisovalerate dehydrogenase E1 component alpha subunit
MDYVRTERKPFLLEAVLSRLYGHSSASGANRVLDEADCLKGFEQKLQQRGLLTQQQADEMRQKYTQELLEVHKRIREEPQPDGKTIFEHVFSEVDLVRAKSTVD